ncbi:Alpha/beta hydrolase fold [Trema orientale]|uniref:Alpha/beta hydrolase fold n=1 Tax=Trema orientale TaxID=63057 RepID=A0A2P5ETR5_TREOI|nr:Alpha/beta hydrolase fold [Trema orientale]
MAWSKLWSLPSFYLLSIWAIYKHLVSGLVQSNGVPILVKLIEIFLGLHFRFHGLSPCTIDLDDQTTMHFWTANHRRFDKPDLVMVHGYGGNSIWQFLGQVGPLSKAFNLYLPDLLFFGKSHTKQSDRSEIFQAKCVVEGLKRLGLNRFSLYGISYGGYVAYRMAEMCPEEVEKVVIVSSGIVWTEDQKEELLYRKYGRNGLEILLPESPRDLRLLVNLSVYKFDPLKWVPDLVLRKFVQATKEYRKEKFEMVEHLLTKTPDSNFPILTQETLIIWGDRDNVFPLCLAYQLQRHLGPKSKLEIIKDTGHAANIDSPEMVNALTKSFVLN